MAHSIPFDTLAFAKELETAGVPTVQAEAHAKVMAATIQKVEEFRLEELSTKGDVLRLEKEVELSKAELRKDIELSKAELRKEIESSKVEIVKWVVATGMIILGGMATINRLSPPAAPYYVQAPGQEMRTTPPIPPAANVGK